LREGISAQAGRKKVSGGFGSAFIVIISWETNEETSELNLWLTGFARTSNKRNCGSAVIFTTPNRFSRSPGGLNNAE
jgi:hypothetical protein